eukprot:307855_1
MKTNEYKTINTDDNDQYVEQHTCIQLQYTHKSVNINFLDDNIFCDFLIDGYIRMECMYNKKNLYLFPIVVKEVINTYVERDEDQKQNIYSFIETRKERFIPFETVWKPWTYNYICCIFLFSTPYLISSIASIYAGFILILYDSKC